MAVIMACAYGGTGHYLTLDNIVGADVRASHTVMCRVKWTVTTTTENYYAATLLASAGTSGTFVGRVASDAATVSRGGRRSTTPTYNTVSNTGSFGDTTTWRHLACVYNASTQIAEYYIDGVSIGTISSLTTLVAADTAGAFGVLAKGKIADVALYNRVLTAAEVLQMATYRVLSVTSNCLGFYRMDTNSTGGTTEGTAADTSGSGNNLPAVTSAGGTGFTYSTADNPPQTDNPVLDGDLTSGSTLSATITVALPVASTLSSASTLTGTSTISKPAAGSLASASTLTGALGVRIASTATSATTLSAWIRPRWGRRIEAAPALNRDSNTLRADLPWTIQTWVRGVTIGVGDTAFFIARNSGTAQPNLSLNVQDGGSGTTVAAVSFTDSAGTLKVNYTSSAVGTAWHHLAATHDGAGIIRTYLDGTLVDTSTAASLTGGATFDRFRYTRNAAAVAEYAQSKVWSKQLTAAEIVAELTYNTPFNQLSSLYAWWQLSWQSPTLDSSGNGNTLTDTGSTEAQSESPGQTMFLLAGSSTSASTLTGALSVAKPLAANSITSASTLTAALTTTVPLTANALTSASTLSAALGQTIAVVGTAVTSASTLTGALVQAQPLVGTTLTSASTLTGALGTAKPLTANALTSASTLSGAVIQSQTLASSLTSASTLSATIGVNGVFAGTATSASTLTAALGVAIPLAASTATSASTLSASMVQVYAVTSTATSASTLTGDLKALFPIAATATSASTLSGTITVTYPIAGSVTSATTLSAALTVTQPLAATATSASTLTGALLATNQLVGSATSATTLTGALTIQAIRLISGVSFSASTLSASLTVLQIASATGDTYTHGETTVFYSGAEPGPLQPERRWPPRPR
jgi:hypothetical protein